MSCAKLSYTDPLPLTWLLVPLRHLNWASVLAHVDSTSLLAPCPVPNSLTLMSSTSICFFSMNAWILLSICAYHELRIQDQTSSLGEWSKPTHSGQSTHFKGWGFEMLKNCKRVGVHIFPLKRVGVHIFPLKRVDWYKGWKQTIKGGVLQTSKLCTYIYKTKLKK